LSEARRRGRTPPPPVAALDLGTNNCRLLIAEPTRRGRIRVIDSFSRIVRLGEGVARTGLLSEAAMTRTVEALRVCARQLAEHRVGKLRAVATEACRRAANSCELVARVREATGIELEIISSDEEARLAAVGCAPLIDEEAEGALVFDIGGGSTETIWLKRDAEGVPRVVYAHSEPLGVVTLAEAGHGGEIGREGFARVREEAMARLTGVKAAMAARGDFDPYTHHLLGTSGTVTTLAALALGLPRYDRGKVDASWHDCDGILAVIEWLLGLDLAARAALGPVGPDRADLIVPGCAVFAAIHALWPCRQLRVADRGLREGMLRELMGRA
jgi:exopolyphosphatase/guanosine-5'-triphosphate,3'-diphosphate pyrophosphatase